MENKKIKGNKIKYFVRLEQCQCTHGVLIVRKIIGRQSNDFSQPNEKKQTHCKSDSQRDPTNIFPAHTAIK